MRLVSSHPASHGDSKSGTRDSEQTVLTTRVTYVVGVGLTVWADYIGFDVEDRKMEDDTLLMSSAQISF